MKSMEKVGIRTHTTIPLGFYNSTFIFKKCKCVSKSEQKIRNMYTCLRSREHARAHIFTQSQIEIDLILAKDYTRDQFQTTRHVLPEPR